MIEENSNMEKGDEELGEAEDTPSKFGFLHIKKTGRTRFRVRPVKCE